MLKLFIFALAICIYGATASTRTVSDFFSSSDVARLKHVFTEGLKSNDLQSIYYASLNQDQISPNDMQSVCKRLESVHADSKLNDFEKNFYLAGTHKKLACSTTLSQKVVDAITSSLSKEIATSQEIYFNLFASQVLGLKVDAATADRLAKNLQNILKKDDSLSSLGYAFYVAVELGAPGSFVVERVEDAIVQADEVDGRMLQFEGGLSITGLIVNGALKLTKTFKKPEPITEDQASKFAAYFLTRRSVQTAKGAHVLLEALRTISERKNIAPICIKVIGSGQLQADTPVLTVTLVDILGAPITAPVTSIFGKVVTKKESSVLAEKVQFVSKSSDKTVFSADLSAYKPRRGLYSAEVSAGIYQHTVHFKVLGKVKVQSLEIGVGDTDATSALKKQSVSYPSRLQEVLSADNTQKVVLKVVLADESSNELISVHQAFIRLVNKATNEEIIFVAEQDNTRAYKFDIDVGARSADFGHNTGLYRFELIVGDASLSNSFKWHVADINLKFSQDLGKDGSAPHKLRAPKPEIVHMFREPEKRPPRFFSDLFTGLCLTPLLILLFLWAKLRVSISNFLSLSTLGFHLGLGSILGLFVVFWLQLNMFETIRYLIPLALFTFLCGNRMLRAIAAQKQPAS